MVVWPRWFSMMPPVLRNRRLGVSEGGRVVAGQAAAQCGADGDAEPDNVSVLGDQRRNLVLGPVVTARDGDPVVLAGLPDTPPLPEDLQAKVGLFGQGSVRISPRKTTVAPR
jgi:hypothetical protein